MSSIKILSAQLAGRIAAGEVIERPASVIKELVENSIDAGATRIRVFTEQGGQRMMQVIDDGKGMDREDAMLCLEAHATSKLSEDGDVGNIHTLGFRGEALPSISSVSRFEMMTRPTDCLNGTRVVVNNGVIADVCDCGCAPGTSIRVAYLFGNLPVRRKFLKGPTTEDDFIHEMLLMLALSRPGIAFELTQNNREMMRIPANTSIADRIKMLLGKDAFEAMLPVDHSENGIHVYGYISKPGFTRSNRREQRIIINHRAASADTVYFAIRDAYDTLILRGRYPGVVLYIDLADDRVDVNVHPSKREVRFRDPAIVSSTVATALRSALRGMASGAPEETNANAMAHGDAAMNALARENAPTVSFTGHAASIEVANNHDIAHSSINTPAPIVFQPIQAPLPFSPVETAQTNNAQATPNESVSAPIPPMPEAQVAPSHDESAVGAYQLHGRLGKEYLLAECETGLIVVNIRTAMQRILFERMLANLRDQKITRQQLLLPLTLSLSPDESRLMTRELEHFNALGYTIEPFGDNSFLLTAIPANMQDSDLRNAIHDILSDLRRSSVTNRGSAVHLAQITSRYTTGKCDPVSHAEQEAIIKELMHCEMPYADPNGLPTMLHISYSELTKRFKG